MLMEGRPAVEEKKATGKIVRLTIRHSMRIECLQIDDIRLPQTRRNKSHPHIRFCGLLVSENITRPCFIERPNSNLTIPSGFFFFHRGLPFFKRGQSNKLHWSIHVSTHMHPHLYAMSRCGWISKGLQISEAVLRHGAFSAPHSMFIPRWSLPARVLRRLARRTRCV